MSWDKTTDRIIRDRANYGRLVWDSGKDGTFNRGRNKAKRARRAAAKQHRAARVAAANGQRVPK